jgi:putative ABC transport system permease protein
MRIPIINGREFQPTDTANNPRVAVINAEFARRHWPGKDPVGRRIQIFPETQVWREVVGVVADVRFIGLDVIPEPAVYVPYAQNPFVAAAQRGYLVVRTNDDVTTMHGALRKEIRALDPSQAISRPLLVADILANSVKRNRVAAIVLSAFAVFSLFLAVIGIYGVTSLFVSVRTHEIGTRIALGAERHHIYRLIVGEAAVLGLIAIVAGAAASILLARWLKQVLFQITALDPVTISLGSLLLLTATLAAAFIPARRATRVDPLEALRGE